MDAGLATLCNLVNTAEGGDMPKEQLVPWETLQFETRNIGVTRFYAAQGANQQIDMLIRVWRVNAKIGMYAVLTDYEGQENENGDQYQIDAVQHTLNADSLKVTDLTLRRVDRLYEVLTDES